MHAACQTGIASREFCSHLADPFGSKRSRQFALHIGRVYRRLPKIHDPTFSPLAFTFVMRHCVSLLLAVGILISCLGKQGGMETQITSIVDRRRPRNAEEDGKPRADKALPMGMTVYSTPWEAGAPSVPEPGPVKVSREAPGKGRAKEKPGFARWPTSRQ